MPSGRDSVPGMRRGRNSRLAPYFLWLAGEGTSLQPPGLPVSRVLGASKRKVTPEARTFLHREVARLETEKPQVSPWGTKSLAVSIWNDTQ